MSRSFASNWVVYAALSSALKTGLFRGQKTLAAQAQNQVKRMANPRTSFGRQLKLLKAIQAKPGTTTGLCRTAGISRRTLFRDLAALRNAGVGIVSDGTNFKLKDKKLQAVLGKFA
jgi:hypothetical protein